MLKFPDNDTLVLDGCITFISDEAVRGLVRKSKVVTASGSRAYLG